MRRALEALPRRTHPRRAPDPCLGVRRVVAPAQSAVNHEVMDLILVGVHEDGVAVSAGIIDRVVCTENLIRIG